MQLFNKNLSPKIIQELIYLDEKFFTFDKPIPFLDNLFLYPVMVEDYAEFLNCSQCCTLNKNDTNEGITMKHLDFLLWKIENEPDGDFLLKKLFHLFEMVFHKSNGLTCQDCGEEISFMSIREFMDNQNNLSAFCCPKCQGKNFSESIKFIVNPKTNHKEISVFGNILNAQNFDRFRQIVMYQNLPNYKDDSWVNLEIRQDQSERIRLATGNKNLSASLEKKLVCVMASTHYKLEDILQLSLRKFLMLLDTVDDLVNYATERVGRMAGLNKFKGDLEHWIYKPSNSNLYKGAVTLDSLKNKINNSH